MSQPKILLLDLETFPNLSYTWGVYDQNVVEVVQEKCIATFSAKWLGDKKMISRSLPDYKGYKPGSYDDEGLVKDLWKLLDEADIVVAHNGDDFDIKFAQARFLKYGMVPPTPYKTVDTLKVSRRLANFNSHKLDDLGALVGFGRKLKTGFSVWRGCIDGDMKSWKTMVAYNDQDVLLLEKWYLRLRPWIATHPNFTNGEQCPKCGSTKLQWRGLQRAITRTYRRFHCTNCGGWGRSVKSEKEGSSKVTNCG
jgi:hypothetical protein